VTAGTKTGRTTAHSAAQLQRALEFTPDQWGRARAAGLIPQPDLKTPRWSGRLTDTLITRRGEILAALPDDLTSTQLMTALDLDYAGVGGAPATPGSSPRRTGATTGPRRPSASWCPEARRSAARFHRSRSAHGAAPGGSRN
jgi:hypothetical protein